MAHQDDYRAAIAKHRTRERKRKLTKQRGKKPADQLRGESLGYARGVCCRLEEAPTMTNVTLALDALRKIEYRLRQLQAGHRLERLEEAEKL